MTDTVSSEIIRRAESTGIWDDGTSPPLPRSSHSSHDREHGEIPEELSEAGRDSLLQALKKIRESEAMLGEKDRYIQQLRRSIKELAKQLKGVAQFIDMREDIEERLNEMERYHREEIARFKDMAQTAHLDMLENKVKLRLEEQILRQNHDRDVTAKATKLLDKRTREVNDQNFELVKDKLLLARDMEIAREQSAKLEAENATLRRKAELATGAESELLVRSVAQKKQIAMLKKQIKTTEDNIEKIVEEYDKRLEQQEKTLTKQIKERTKERDDARHDALVMQTELKRLRDASAVVSNLHNELQLFFHEALRDVRMEVFEERRRAITGVPCGTINKALHTSSSALRLETQPRLMITDVYGTLSRSRGEWSTDRRGFPVLLPSKDGSPYPSVALFPHEEDYTSITPHSNSNNSGINSSSANPYRSAPDQRGGVRNSTSSGGSPNLLPPIPSGSTAEGGEERDALNTTIGRRGVVGVVDVDGGGYTDVGSDASPYEGEGQEGFSSGPSGFMRCVRDLQVARVSSSEDGASTGHSESWKTNSTSNGLLTTKGRSRATAPLSTSSTSTKKVSRAHLSSQIAAVPSPRDQTGSGHRSLLPPPPAPGLLDDETVEDAELVDTAAYQKNPHAVPSAPTLKDLQQVDIRQLTWSEKERVIYYLFKRLQQNAGNQGRNRLQNNHSAQHSNSSTDRDAEELNRASETFLTQQ